MYPKPIWQLKGQPFPGLLIFAKNIKSETIAQKTSKKYLQHDIAILSDSGINTVWHGNYQVA